MCAYRPERTFDGRVVLTGGAAVVLVRDGLVVDVGVKPPADAEVVDLFGATLLPGLVDTHVHLGLDASLDPVATLAGQTDAELLTAMEGAARRALEAGITTVRDLGDRNYASLALRGRADLPTILAAGPPITVRDGHCHFMGGATDGTGSDVRRAVREHAERGVDVIKVMASGGTLTPNTRQEKSQFDQAALTCLVEEAHRLGIPVTAHTHGTASIVEALKSGVDGMEHVTFWAETGVDAPDWLIEALARAGTWLGATLGFDPPGQHADLPSSLRDRLPAIDASTVALIRAGARVVAGTDAGVAPVKHHGVLPYAARQLRDLGLSSTEALSRVTADAARACSLAGRKGMLVAGADADLLIVDGDPTRDLSALHQVRAVHRAGVRVVGAATT